jgi:hypothetical protein
MNPVEGKNSSGKGLPLSLSSSSSDESGELRGRTASHSSGSPRIESLKQKLDAVVVVQGLRRMNSNSKPNVDDKAVEEKSEKKVTKSRSGSAPILYVKKEATEKKSSSSPSSPSFFLIERRDAEPIKSSIASNSIPITGENADIVHILEEFIATEQTFFEFLNKLEKLKQKLDEQPDFFNFLKDYKSNAEKVFGDLLRVAKQWKTFSFLFIKVFNQLPKEPDTHFQVMAKLLSSLSYQSFSSVANDYNTYLSFTRELSSNKAQKLRDLLKEELEVDFETITITMIQRLPRYELFIKDLISKSHDEIIKQALLQALEKVQKGITAMNENVKQKK